MKRLTGLLVGLICAICLVFGVAACNTDPGESGLGLKISQETADIDITQSSTLQLSATVEKSGNYVFSWTSSNKNVATVHPTSGLVTAVSAGTATITVSCREKGTVNELESKTCVVNVTTPEGYYNIVTGTSGVAQNENVKNDPGVWYLYYGSALNASALYCVKDSVTMNVSGIKGTWYLRYYPKFTAGTMLDISFTVTLDADAYIRLSAGGTIEGGGVEYRYLEAGTHDVTLNRILGDIPFSISLTTMPGTDSASGTTDSFYAGDLNLKLTNLSFTEGVKLTDASGNIAKSAYINVAKGESELQLDALPPAGGEDIVWSSSEEGVATVDQSGKVTAVDAGSTVITAASGSKKATCTVTVITKEVKLNADYVILDTEGAKAPSSYRLKVKASDGSALDVKWSSENTDVATVDADGLVTAVAGGSSKVTASVEGMIIECLVAVGDSTYGQAYAVNNVAGKESSMQDVGKWYTSVNHTGLKSVNYENGAISVEQDSNLRTINLIYQPLLEVGARYSVSFTLEAASGDMGAKADRLQFGVGTGYNAGTDINADYETLITGATSLTCTGEFAVSAENPFFITFRVQKSKYSVKDITFNKVADPEKSALTGLQSQSATLTLGDGENNTATIQPVVNLVSDFDEVTVTYESLDTGIATVDNNGTVTAVSAGTTKINVSDGVNTFEFTVIVSDGQTTPTVILVSISPQTATLDKAGVTYGNTVQIIPTFSEEGGCALTYNTSDGGVATVSDSGLVTAVAVGECTITVSDGTYSYDCEITVINSNAAKLTGISADGLILDLSNSSSSSAAKLDATVTGEDAESVTVTWTSDNTAVATVDQNGNVTAVAAGVANITASDGKNSKTCKTVVGDSARELGDYTLGGTASDAAADPEKWFGYGDNDTAFVANYAGNKISVTKASGAEKSFYLYYQPLLPVGTRYSVSVTVTRDGGKNLGTIKRFQFGTGTGYNASADTDKVKIVTDNTGTSYQQNSLTVSGEFTVSGTEPFYISFRTTNTGFSFEITFTPVAEEEAAQVTELEALPANGKENG